VVVSPIDFFLVLGLCAVFFKAVILTFVVALPPITDKPQTAVFFRTAVNTMLTQNFSPSLFFMKIDVSDPTDPKFVMLATEEFARKMADFPEHTPNNACRYILTKIWLPADQSVARFKLVLLTWFDLLLPPV
jgi:hypothetical protein